MDISSQILSHFSLQSSKFLNYCVLLYFKFCSHKRPCQSQVRIIFSHYWISRNFRKFSFVIFIHVWATQGGVSIIFPHINRNAKVVRGERQDLYPRGPGGEIRWNQGKEMEITRGFSFWKIWTWNFEKTCFLVSTASVNKYFPLAVRSGGIPRFWGNLAILELLRKIKVQVPITFRVWEIIWHEKREKCFGELL